MEFIADLHIHGKYSRACSKELTIPMLEKWAKVKGITLLGTGDFTHPKWIEHIKEELKEDGSGFLRAKTGFPFILQTEISLIYSQGGRGRRAYILLYAPTIKVAEQITEALKKRGRVDYDGRPIFKIPCIEIVDMMRAISDDIEVVPAHCLPPEELIICNNSVKPISQLNVGDNVLTHKGRLKNIKKIYKHNYSGKLYHIIPWKLSFGTKTTEEHPFYCYKSYKCPWTKAVCKPTCHVKTCKNKRYLEYKAEWVPAKELKVGDILLYPIIQDIGDIKEIKLKDYLKKESCEKWQKLKNNATIKITSDFCRLIGYYLAEGYTNNRDAITFTFHKNEKNYINDVVSLMQNIFGLKHKIGKSASNTADLVFYSKNVHEFFANFCYEGEKHNACTKRIPGELLYLPLEKQAELLKGWWYGDAGYTSSLVLATQMKSICLRLGILPAFRADDLSKYNKKIGDRRIYATSKSYSLCGLTFFEDRFNLLNDSAFKKFKSKKTTRHGWIDGGYAYLPIRDIKLQNYDGEVYNLEVEEDNSYISQAAAVHNCWTPWFAVFGSNGGFDSLEEAFGANVKYIHSIESGISSDPAMNWRLSKLDKINIVSFSDLHS